MEWFKFHTSWARMPEFIGLEPSARAAWLCLLAYCADQENAGIIVGGAHWNDRKWQQLCGITKEEMSSAEPLVRIENDDVLVSFYPEDDLKRIKKLRSTSRKAANARWDAKRMPHGIQNALPTHSDCNANCNAEERRGEKKREDKSRGEESEIVAFCREVGLPDSDGAYFFNKCVGNGWTNGGKPIKDWKATVRSWKSAGYMPSQKRNGSAVIVKTGGAAMRPGEGPIAVDVDSLPDYQP